MANLIKFSDQQIADLLLAIATINAGNRIAIASRVIPGTYEPQQSVQLLAAN